MTREQYQQIKRYSKESKIHPEESKARKYAEVKAFMFMTRDLANLYQASIEDQQTHFWAEQKFRYYSYTKNFRKYSERADEIIHQFAG